MLTSIYGFKIIVSEQTWSLISLTIIKVVFIQNESSIR